MRACGLPTPRGPCARPGGHTTGTCLDVADYAEQVCREQRDIVGAANAVIAALTSSGSPRGGVAILGPARLRRAVVARILAEVTANGPGFARAVIDTFELEIAAAPATEEPIKLATFLATTIPEFCCHTDPVGAIAALFRSYLDRKVGVPLLCCDDASGLAAAAPEVAEWMCTWAREVPVILATDAAGWARAGLAVARLRVVAKVR